MATRKAGATAKKTTKKSPAAKPSTTTNVTTVKAVSTPVKPAVSPKKTNYAAVARVLAAEFIGTFLLAAIYIVTKGEPLYLGFALVAIVLTIGAISGAHVNPLITVGAWVTKKISGARAGGYLLAQVLGAVVALGVLTTFVGGAPAPAAADSQQALMGQQQSPKLHTVAQMGKADAKADAENARPHVAEGKELYVLFAELFGAMVFSFAVANAWRNKLDRAATAFNVGFGLFVAALLAGVATSYVSANAIVNPAIALTVGAIDWGNINYMAIAIYFLTPLFGGVLGFAIADALRSDKSDEVVAVK